MKHLSRFLLTLVLVITGAMTAYAQSKLSGQVTDETGEPLPGVTIMQKGTTNGVATNIDGRYTIILNGNKPAIVARYVGYAPVETQIKPGQTVLDIRLTPETNAMNELVVVGYGQQKKVNLTGAVDQVTNEVFDGRPTANVAQMLEGVVPNLNISMSDGRPIRSSDFNIRGTGSINGGSALVLIDGVEGDPALLNPADIASVSVLKDAASAAIYGARAPFGVVLITTKNPNAGKAKVQYQSIYSLQSPQNTPKMVTDGYEFASHFYDAWYGFNHTTPSSINKTQEFSMDWLTEYAKRKEEGNFGTVISDGSIGTKGRYVYYNDNLDSFDLLYKDNTFATTQNLSISGSDNKFDYYISGRFYHYDGLFDSDRQTDKLNQYNLRFKGGYQATSWFKINNNFEFSYSRYKMPRTYNEVNGNVWRNIIGEGHPSSPLLNPDGTQTYSGVYSLADFLYGDSYEMTTKHQFKNTTSFIAKLFKNRLTIQGDLTFRHTTT
ncbi:MAG: TonB-dependent receptor plug domain-containing protein, partial [Muribaculaceae bacterium]|nr:TonB-dependent receptor plug domain-containing protein [Muribaculaceae bacterium]